MNVHFFTTMLSSSVRSNRLSTPFLQRHSTLQISRIRCFTAMPTIQNKKKKWYKNWHYWSKLLRYTRIPVLVLSVYGIGYQQGIIDTTRTPLAMRHGLLTSILKSTHVTHADQVQIMSSSSSSSFTNVTPQQAMVMAVGQQILNAARTYVQEQLQQALQQAALEQQHDDLPTDMTLQQQIDYLQSSSNNDTIQLWQQALLRLNGEDKATGAWTYVWIQQPQQPNAFVTEILPRHLFVTTGMCRIATTPDEWAVVLGHEISHLILGHNSQTNQMELFLRTAEVLLLSLDPTEGVVGVAVIAALAALHRGFAAAYSREHERQADALGLILAARACFDTAKGVHVMHKMHQHAVSAAPEGLGLSLWDTHPPSLERYQQLQQASQTEHPARYTHCQTMTSRFLRALRKTNTQE